MTNEMASDDVPVKAALDPDVGVTFATLRSWAEDTIKLANAAKVDRMSPLAGARSAARDVLAILDKHGAPPNEAVHFGNYPED